MFFSRTRQWRDSENLQVSPSIQKEMEAAFFGSCAPAETRRCVLKEATFEYLLSHRFDVSIFIDSHYEQRNRSERMFECREVTSVTKAQVGKVIASILLYLALFAFYVLLITNSTKVACR